MAATRKQKRRSGKHPRTRHRHRRGGGNVLDTACDLTPIRPEDFTPENIEAWKTPVEIYPSPDQIPSDVTEAHVFNLNPAIVACKIGRHNKVCLTTCGHNGDGTPLVLRQSIRRISGGGKPLFLRVKLPSATDPDLETKRIHDHIHEMFVQCLISVIHCSPQVYMIGVNKVDGLNPYCVMEAMDNDLFLLMKSIDRHDKMELVCSNAETLFRKIAHLSPFLMLDIKPANLVYEYRKRPSGYDVYMIDFDTQYCIVDDERMYSTKEEMHTFDDIKTRIMTFLFYLFVCTHTSKHLDASFWPFFVDKLQHWYRIDAQVTLAPTLVLFFLKYPHFKQLFDGYFSENVFDEHALGRDILAEIYHIPLPHGTPVFVAPPFSIDACNAIVEKRKRYIGKTKSKSAAKKRPV